MITGLVPVRRALAADAVADGTVAGICSKLPSNCFPPNQLVRLEKPDHLAVSVLNSSRQDQWAEFFLEVPAAGTYLVNAEFLKGPNKAICRMVALDDAVGDSIDLYAPEDGGAANIAVGNVTFPKPGNYSLRFVVEGKNPSSGGNVLVMRKITLTPTKGFTLAAPNHVCFPDGNVLFCWNAWPEAKSYRVEMDAKAIATVDAPLTEFKAKTIAAGAHRWRAIALSADRKQTASNSFAFNVGATPPSPYRDFSDEFSTESMKNWSAEAMALDKTSDGHGVLRATAPAWATLQNICLEKAEGEISTQVTLHDDQTMAGVGFQADDGTRIYAIADVRRGQLRIERRVKGYSIFDVTPKAYQMKQWSERPEGDAMVWEIAATPVTVRAGVPYQIKLAFSRRSNCVMGTLISSDGSETSTVRGLCDLRTPDHPLLLCLSGAAHFAQPGYRHLNKLVYKWDPDTVRIVLRPGDPGSWDAKGAFNPAVVIRNGTWYMVYRGNARPAPPNGAASSELGLATSTDGVHWTKSPANPIIPRPNGKGTEEDPDLLWPKDSDQVYLEYRSYQPTSGEVMRSSTDWIHWSDEWTCNSGKTFGKMGGMLDALIDLDGHAFLHNSISYRYLTMIEEGRIDLSNDLKTWVKAGVADLKGTDTAWCNGHECSGDIFVDHDKNIRYESQAGVRTRGKAADVSGNPLCTIVEGVLSGSNPTKIIWKSDLPWLPDWYGDAPTGSPENFTATNGSVFPGQTVISDGWLWHLSGGNNTFTVLCKCKYGPVWECRDLQTKSEPTGACAAWNIVRNVGSLPGSEKMVLRIDGQPCAEQQISLDPDAETTVHWNVVMPAGRHLLSVEDLSVAVAAEQTNQVR